jgi:phosphopantetheinyl transferase
VERFADRNTLAKPQPDGWTVVFERWPDLASRDLVMRTYLNADERAHHDRCPARGRRQWLLGRIAAKDAVRQLLFDRGVEAVFPIEVSVRSEADGRPVVSTPYLEHVRVSIAHKGPLTLALARHGADAGVDVERIEPRSDRFAAIAFSREELAILADRGDHDEWVTRLWCAKEAAGKARGTGLGGSPRTLSVTEVEGERILVDGTWVETRRTGEFVVAWTVA